MFVPAKFQCDAAFISKVLGREVSAVKVSYPPQGWSRGMCRLELEPTGISPETVIVKYDAVDDDSHNVFERVLKYLTLNHDTANKREVFFYENIKKIVESRGVCTPECYYSSTYDSSFLNVLFDSKTSFLTIILEDLKDYSNSPVASPLPENHILLAFLSLARIHASCWNTPQLLPEQYKSPLLWSQNFSLEVPSFKSLKESIDDNAQYLGCDLQVLKEAISYLLPYYQKTIKYYNYFAYKEDPKARNGNLFQHFTLLHGDYHCGNLFFKPEDKPDLPKDVIHIDWQCYGLGPCAGEVVYFLCTVPMDTSQHGLFVDAYYEELMKNLEKPLEFYPLEVLKEEMSVLLFKDCLSAITQMGGLVWKMVTKSDRFKEFAPTVLKVNTIKFNYFISEVNKWQKEGKFKL